MDSISENSQQPLQGCSASIGKLVEARAAAQKHFRVPKKTQKVRIRPRDPSKAPYEYHYAPFPELLDATMQALADQGLVVFHRLGSFKGDVWTYGVQMILAHSSGEFITSVYEIEPTMDMKERGGQISYARRYLYEALVGISGAEEEENRIHNEDVIEKLRAMDLDPAEKVKKRSEDKEAATSEPPPDAMPPLEVEPNTAARLRLLDKLRAEHKDFDIEDLMAFGVGCGHFPADSKFDDVFDAPLVAKYEENWSKVTVGVAKAKMMKGERK